MKTKEEILISKFGEYQDIKQKPFPKIIEAMQEHTDQAIAAYKLKLKEQIDKEVEDDERLSGAFIKELIDTTTI